MLTRDQLFAALANANVQALGRVVRQGETDQSDAAYRRRYNGAGPAAYFESFADHPRILVAIPNDPQGRSSSAAGAYQITRTTWDTVVLPALHAIFGLDAVDFSPPMQDAAFVVLLHARNALNLIVTGQLEAAIAACHDEWTSLPGAAENHRTWTLAKARELYLQYGGKLQPNTANAAITPSVIPARQSSPEEPMGAIALPLLTSLIPQVLQLFTGRAQAQLGKVTGDPAAAGAFMQSMIAKVGDVVGVPVTDDTTAVQAVGKLTAAPVPDQVQAIERHALDYLDHVAPVIEKMALFEAQARVDTRADLNDSVVRKNPSMLTQRTLAWMIFISLILLGAAMVLSMAMMWFQVFKSADGHVDAFVASLATMAFMAITSIAQSPFRSIFGQLFTSDAASTAGSTVQQTNQQIGGKQ